MVGAGELLEGDGSKSSMDSSQGGCRELVVGGANTVQEYRSWRYFGVPGQGSPNCDEVTGRLHLVLPLHTESNSRSVVGCKHRVDHELAVELEEGQTELVNRP